MVIAKDVVDAIIQNLAEYVRWRWPATHELVDLQTEDECVELDLFIESGAFSYTFDSFNSENTPAEMLESGRKSGEPVPACCDFMDWLEDNMSRFYRERQPNRAVNIPGVGYYEHLCSWFEIEIDDEAVYIRDTAGSVATLYTDEACINKQLDVLENILRQYEARWLAIEDMARVLPLPISWAILQHM